MNKEIEIEYKTLLTEDEFFQLHQALPFPEKPVIQLNHYFETENFDLKRKRAALRIREKNESFTLTLKEAFQDIALESHDPLSSEEAEAWLQGKPIPKEKVSAALKKLHIKEAHLQYFGSLKTERYHYQDQGIDYMLDKSYYGDQVDYELEIEAPSREEGRDAMRKLLRDFAFIERKAQPKIARFFSQLLPERSSHND